MRLLAMALCSILAIIGCSKSKTSSSSAGGQQETPAQEPINANAPSDRGHSDACSLLTGQEIESIQGAAPKETKPSGNSKQGLIVSQCLSLFPTETDSIVVTSTRRGNGSDARDPKQLWERIFHSADANTKEREEETDEEENESARPNKIPGLGDEAFWVSQHASGVLYVLKGNNYIMIRVGGAGDQIGKLQKSKSLAELVLRRL